MASRVMLRYIITFLGVKTYYFATEHFPNMQLDRHMHVFILFGRTSKFHVLWYITQFHVQVLKKMCLRTFTFVNLTYCIGGLSEAGSLKL